MVGFGDPDGNLGKDVTNGRPLHELDATSALRLESFPSTHVVDRSFGAY